MANFTHLSTLVGGSFSHMNGINTLEAMVTRGGLRIFSVSASDGGINGITFPSIGAASLVGMVTASGAAGMFGFRSMLLPDLFGRDVLVASNPMADNVTFHQVRRDGSLREIGSQWTYGSDLPNLELAEVITVGATAFAYASTVDGAGISGFKIRPNYKVIPLTHDAVDADLAAGSITGLAAAHVGASSYLF